MEGLDFSKLPLDLIINLANIVILFVIVRFLVYKPVRKFLDARKERLENEKQQAAKDLADAQALKVQYEALLAQTDEKTAQLMEQGAAEAREKADAILADARQNAETILADARKDIADEEEKSRRKMQGEAVELAYDILGKLTGQDMNEADRKTQLLVSRAEESLEGTAASSPKEGGRA